MFFVGTLKGLYWVIDPNKKRNELFLRSTKIDPKSWCLSTHLLRGQTNE